MSKRWINALLTGALVIGTLHLASDAMVGAQEAAVARSPQSAEEIADRIGKAESEIIGRMHTLQPIVEVYLQSMDDKIGTTPIHDEYFLGRFQWAEAVGPQLRPLTEEKGSLQHSVGLLSRMFSTQYLPDGFAVMTAPDWRGMDREHYELNFVRREFLGEARCLVFDVQPRGGINEGFSGRIWVEDRDFNIVRFNGISRSPEKSKSARFRKAIPFHVDSWRVNVRPGVWLPAYVYAEEAEPAKGSTTPRIRSQVRLWGYQPKPNELLQALSTVRIDDPTVQDSTKQPQQMAPVLSQRQWAQQAEQNVIERLDKSGLLAAVGSVDKVLETVVQNLEITNKLTIEPEVHCRILLTSPMESFTVGHTIVVSRGLIDVLPDEASLAMVLAHELAHIALDHQVIDARFAFADRLMIPDNDLLQAVRITHTALEETAADAKQVDILNASPYSDKLADAGLFLRAVTAHIQKLPNLIQPHLAEQVGPDPANPRLGALMKQAPQLAPASLDQIAALPLGARLVIDPWSSHVELLRTPNVQPLSAREKLPFTIAPLIPFITYVEAPMASAQPPAQPTAEPPAQQPAQPAQPPEELPAQPPAQAPPQEASTQQVDSH
jgi:Peptidase family M48